MWYQKVYVRYDTDTLIQFMEKLIFLEDCGDGRKLHRKKINYIASGL